MDDFRYRRVATNDVRGVFVCSFLGKFLPRVGGGVSHFLAEGRGVSHFWEREHLVETAPKAPFFGISAPQAPF